MADLHTIRVWEELRQELKLLQWMVTKRIKLPLAVLPGALTTATSKFLDRLHDDPEAAMALSESIASALQKSGIVLEEDETVACLMYVMKRPQYVSEVMDPTPEPAAAGPSPEPSAAGPTPDPILAMYADASADDFPFAEIQSSAWRSIRYKAILEPKIMSAVLKKRSEDRIPY